MPVHLTHLSYRPDIDGLRAIAVLSVVLFHGFPEIFKGGFIGVDIFFVLSGYLISRIIIEQLQQGCFNFFDFYARRIKRIFPALLVVIAALYVFGWFVLLADEYSQLGKHIAAGAAFISNFILWSESGYFDTSAHSKPLLHLWSLAIEEQFYIVWPLLLWLVSKSRMSLFVPIVVLGTLSFYLNVTGIKSDVVATFYSPQTRVWELLVGSALAWCTLGKNESVVSAVLRLRRLADRAYIFRPSANTLSSIGFVVLIYGLSRIDRDLQFPGKWATIPVLGTILIIAAGPAAWLNKKILSNKVMVWFGLISYPLYLWHWPLISLAWIVDAAAPTVAARIGLIVLSIGLAWCTYRLIEGPIRFGKRHKLKVLSLVVSMFTLGAIGLVTHDEQGFPWRHNVRLADALYTSEAHNIEANLVASYRHYAGAEPSQSNKPVVLIVGDSYNANWTVGLSTALDVNQFDIVSVSYLGCKVSVTGEKLTAIASEPKFERYCQPFERWINDANIIRRLAAVMLVSYRPFEYDVNQFRFDVVRALKKKNENLDLFVFGNYFQLNPDRYASCEKLMYRTGRRAEVCLDRADYPKKQMSQSDLPFYPHDLKFTYLDLIGLICHEDKTRCPTEAQGVPFMSDSHHLNATFVAKLIRDLQATQSSKLEALGLRKYLMSRPDS